MPNGTPAKVVAYPLHTVVVCVAYKAKTSPTSNINRNSDPAEMYKPLKGHVLVIPIPSEANKQGKCVTIDWVYFLQDYSGEYYTFVAKNKNSGEFLREQPESSAINEAYKATKLSCYSSNPNTTTTRRSTSTEDGRAEVR